MTHYLLKIPPVIIGVYSNITQALLMLSLSIDVFYLEQFNCVYYCVYLTFIEIIIRCLMFVSTINNNEINIELTKSVVIINIQKAHDSPNDLTYADYALTKENAQLTSIEHYFKIRNLILYEYSKLNILEYNLNKSEYFLFLCMAIHYLLLPFSYNKHIVYENL